MCTQLLTRVIKLALIVDTACAIGLAFDLLIKCTYKSKIHRGCCVLMSDLALTLCGQNDHNNRILLILVYSSRSVQV